MVLGYENLSVKVHISFENLYAISSSNAKMFVDLVMPTEHQKKMDSYEIRIKVSLYNKCNESFVESLDELFPDLGKPVTKKGFTNMYIEIDRENAKLLSRQLNHLIDYFYRNKAELDEMLPSRFSRSKRGSKRASNS